MWCGCSGPFCVNAAALSGGSSPLLHPPQTPNLPQDPSLTCAKSLSPLPCVSPCSPLLLPTSPPHLHFLFCSSIFSKSPCVLIVNHNGVLNFSPAQSSWCHDTWTSLSVVVFRDVQTQLYCGLAIRFNLSTTRMSFSSTNVSP